MPRIPRSLQVMPHFSIHKIWRGHNKEWNLGSDEQKAYYLTLLNADLDSKKYDAGADLQALTLMSNHTHEIFFIKEAPKFSDHMRRHHSKYGAYFNKLHDRCGQVAQDRPKTCLIADDHHGMIATFYIHANPIRAGIVGDARQYRWSTHRLYAFGKRESWSRKIQFPNWYLQLGKNPAERQRKYRQLFVRYLNEYGRRKQRFLNAMFYGPQHWKQEHEQKVIVWRREHSPP